MPEQTRAIAIGLLGAGTPVQAVAKRVGVTPKAIRKLIVKFGRTGHVKDLPRSGHPKGTTPAEDGFFQQCCPQNKNIHRYP